VMVGPGLLQPVSEQLDVGATTRVPGEKTERRSAKSSEPPEKVFHCGGLMLRSFLCSSRAIFRSMHGMPRGFAGGRASVMELRRNLSRGSSKVLPVATSLLLSDLCGTDTLNPMDSVRFGRVLGIGTRLAAKTMVQAVDAATAPNPDAGAKTSAGEKASSAGSATASVGASGRRGSPEGSGARQQAARTAAQVVQTGQGLKEGGKRFNEAFGGKVKRLSGTLWLELTGVFFGIFALSAGIAVWKMRAALHETAANHDMHSRLMVGVLMVLVFGYFCVSSFVKANRRTRGR